MLSFLLHFCVTKPVNAPYWRHFADDTCQAWWSHMFFVQFNFLSETCRYSPAGTSLLSSVPACFQDARASIRLWKQISTHAPYSNNMPSLPDCHPVHLLAPCYDTCHRLAAWQPAVNRDELCRVRTSLLTRWREKELGWFRDTRAGCGF